MSTSTNRVTTWSYDSAGNVTNDGEYTYAFDANNMIKDVDGGSTGVYKYDVDGQRVMKTIGSETIYYVFGVGQYSSASGGDKTYVHLGRKKLLEYSGGTTFFYGTDHLATPRVQTNISATVTETWSSYPYGEEWQQSGPGTEENRFTGHLRDDETALHYAGARFLDEKSRWLSVDPVLGDESNPQRLNRFSYTLSDPVSYVDPNGRQECRYLVEYGHNGERPTHLGYFVECTNEEEAEPGGESGGGGGEEGGGPGTTTPPSPPSPWFAHRLPNLSKGCVDQFSDFTKGISELPKGLLDRYDRRYGSEAVQRAIGALTAGLAALDDVRFLEARDPAGSATYRNPLTGLYGIVIDFDALGDIGGVPLEISLESAIVHELGHIGLLSLGIEDSQDIQEPILGSLSELYRDWKRQTGRPTCSLFPRE